MTLVFATGRLAGILGRVQHHRAVASFRRAGNRMQHDRAVSLFRVVVDVSQHDGARDRGRADNHRAVTFGLAAGRSQRGSVRRAKAIGNIAESGRAGRAFGFSGVPGGPFLLPPMTSSFFYRAYLYPVDEAVLFR